MKWALSRLRNFHDAEDLTQITFVEAFDRLDRLKEPEGLGPWLRTITINRCITFLKRRERIVDYETIQEPASNRPSPQIDAEHAELREKVLAAVGRLSKTQRETVTLYYISEYSLSEIAAIQDVPLGTIKRRLHEARKRLKEDILTMVEDVLENSAPDEKMADRVFELLCAYPSGGRCFDRETIKTIERIGDAGKEGFIRIFELPHARSRTLAAHYLGQKYAQGGPPTNLTLDLLIKGLQDTNRGVRKSSAGALLYGNLKIEPEVYIQKIMPAVIPLLSDSSKRARRTVLFFMYWWIWKVAQSKDQIRAALPLNKICQAMVKERDPKNIHRFQILIEKILDAQQD